MPGPLRSVHRRWLQRIKRVPGPIVKVWYEIVVQLYDGTTGKRLASTNVQRRMPWTMYVKKLEIPLMCEFDRMPSRFDYSLCPDRTTLIKWNSDFYEIGGAASEAEPGARFVNIYAFPTKRREDPVLAAGDVQVVQVVKGSVRTLRSRVIF